MEMLVDLLYGEAQFLPLASDKLFLFSRLLLALLYYFY